MNHAPVRAYLYSVPNLSFLVRSRDLLTPEYIGTRFSSQCRAQLPCTQLIPMLHCSNHPCRALLRVPSTLDPAGTVEPCFSVLGCRAVLLPSDLRALVRSSQSSLASQAVEPCPAGTVGSYSCSLSCRALLQLSDHRALLRSSLSNFTPGTVELSFDE